MRKKADKVVLKPKQTNKQTNHKRLVDKCSRYRKSVMLKALLYRLLNLQILNEMIDQLLTYMVQLNHELLHLNHEYEMDYALNHEHDSDLNLSENRANCV